MNAGYVRLSRDDDKRNYVSIENQKLIINQYAADHGMVIDRWYEDDGVSGYIFDRPGFRQMMADLDKDIDTVLEIHPKAKEPSHYVCQDARNLSHIRYQYLYQSVCI